MRDDSAAPDAGRVERWARALAVAAGRNPDASAHAAPYRGYIIVGDILEWQVHVDTAKALIALADAEAAERRPAATDDDAVYAWVREIYESTGGATPALREAYAAYQAWERTAAGTAGRDGDGREG